MYNQTKKKAKSDLSREYNRQKYLHSDKKEKNKKIMPRNQDQHDQGSGLPTMEQYIEEYQRNWRARRLEIFDGVIPERTTGFGIPAGAELTEPEYRYLMSEDEDDGLVAHWAGDEGYGYLDEDLLFDEIDEPNEAAPKVSDEQIAELPHMQISEQATDDAKCTVCLERYIVGETVCWLPCSHGFHYDCIGPWVKRKNSCPCCRCETFKVLPKTTDQQ